MRLSVENAPGSTEVCLAKAEWQHVLFANSTNRAALKSLSPGWNLNLFSLRVHRNQPFEFVATALAPFLAYGDREARILYSEYDDSLNFADRQAVDVELFWLDYDRYFQRLSTVDLFHWLCSRLKELRTYSDAPLLIPSHPGTNENGRALNELLNTLKELVPGVRLFDLTAIHEKLGADYFDSRAAGITGMTLSNAACTETARRLGLVHLPAVLGPRIKAVILDLDNTLYEGVLGEDGPESLSLTPEHLCLQNELLEMMRSGVFLGAVSKNDPQDVRQLFSTRDDFPLKQEHFSALSINWDTKANGIREITKRLRIAEDAVLFVDDNPGELASVASELPGIRCLHAGNPEETLRALRLYPGLHGFDLTAADFLRISDLAADEARQDLRSSAADPSEYLRSLGIEIVFVLDLRQHSQRLHELSAKTNQFNTNLLRLSEAEILRRMESRDHRVVSIRLSDRLSDSGVIGAVFGFVEGNELLIDEICISCRALGRQIESVIITEAIRGMTVKDDISRVSFFFRSGPRNQPALNWLSEYCAQNPLPGKIVSIEWDTESAGKSVSSTPVGVFWGIPDGT